MIVKKCTDKDPCEETQTTLKPKTSVKPTSSTEPKTSVDPNTSLEPKTSLEPETSLESETSLEPQTTLEPETSSEPALNVTKTHDQSTRKPKKDKKKIFEDFLDKNGELSKSLLTSKSLVNTTGKSCAEIIKEVQITIESLEEFRNTSSYDESEDSNIIIQKKLLQSLLEVIINF